MQKNWVVIFSLLMLFCIKDIKGQDLAYSQFYEQPLLRNPALSGIFNCDVRIKGQYRNQWPTVSIPYQTSALSAEFKMPQKEQSNLWALGLQITNDAAGTVRLQRTEILPTVSFHTPLNENSTNYLDLGISAGYASNQFDPVKATLDDQFINGNFDPSNPTSQVFDKTGVSYFDANAGFVVDFTFTGNQDDGYFYAGVAAYHLNRPKVASYTGLQDVYLNRKWVLNTGLVYPFLDGGNLVSFTDFSIQGGNRLFIGGLLFGKSLKEYDNSDPDMIYFGGIYRWNDAIIPVIKLTINGFAGSISYDANISKLTVASGTFGALELSLSYAICLPDRAQLPCPHFKF